VGKSSSITLSTGREVRLHELTQRLTYEDLLEGMPTTKMNEAYLDRIVADHRAKRSEAPCHLVKPAETPIALAPGETYRFGVPATLPAITCTGRFRSHPIGLDDPVCYSELTLIWLQREFALPIEPAVMQTIAGLDWDALAANFEF
jgi:hypothetical protein